MKVAGYVRDRARTLLHDADLSEQSTTHLNSMDRVPPQSFAIADFGTPLLVRFKLLLLQSVVTGRIRKFPPLICDHNLDPLTLAPTSAGCESRIRKPSPKRLYQGKRIFPLSWELETTGIARHAKQTLRNRSETIAKWQLKLEIFVSRIPLNIEQNACGAS